MKTPFSHGTRQSLLRWFIANALDIENARPLSAPSVSDTYYNSLCSLATLLVADGIWTEDAILQLQEVMAEFGHRHLGVPRGIPLGIHLYQTLRGEPALYVLKQRYRDHFFHTVEVCLLGYTLLTSCPHSARSATREQWCDLILKDCASWRKTKKGPVDTAIPLDRVDFLRQWWVAAMLHDTAYGIDILGGTLDLLDFFKKCPELSGLLSSIRFASSTLGGQQQKFFPELEHASLKGGDHGVVTASYLLSFLSQINPSLKLEYLPAARAIAFHNSHDPSVNAGKDPVAAMLILCDEIQHWGRSNLGYERAPEAIQARLVSGGVGGPDQFGDVDFYTLNMISSSSASDGLLNWSTPRNLDFKVILSERVHGTLRHPDEKRVAYIWGGSIYNLQRVDFRPWSVTISLEYLSPIPSPQCPTCKEPCRNCGKKPCPACRAKAKTRLDAFRKRFENVCKKALKDPSFRGCELLRPFFDELELSPGKAIARHREKSLSAAPGAPSRKYESIELNLTLMGGAAADGKPLMGMKASLLQQVLEAK